MHAEKIFCIGFQKTGTSSMGKALEYLGYSVCGAVGLRDPDIPNNIKSIAFDQIEKYDAFQDNPWPILYKELDAKYPGSKFILTRRNTESWINSVVGHFGSTPQEMERWIYGAPYPEGNQDVFIERYQRHNQEVLDYFADRPDDLLVLDIESGDLWQPLADFLGKEMPAEPFPHANMRRPWWRAELWVRKKVRRLKKLLKNIVG